MAWHRQYRPQRIADLHIGSVREQLQAVLNSGRFAQAYLFAGPKGTGKTSTARILARILNEPKNETAIRKRSGKLEEPSSETSLQRQIAAGQSTMVIEQDAASHRGIDDVRQLQEQIGVAPAEGLIRVVILDEVHMFTAEAFNALLKMLEEPPERVVFVLATTELHKVPATIQSRCQLIQFRQATGEEIGAALQGIAEKEGFSLSGEEAQRIATAARGSFRDAVKVLEQVVHDGLLDQRLLELAIGTDTEVEGLLRALAKKDLAAVSTFFQRARSQGSSLRAVESTLIAALQQRLHRAIERQEKAATIQTVLRLLDHLASRLDGPEPLEGLKLELACLSWCLPHSAETAPDSAPPARPAAACEKDETQYSVSAPVAPPVSRRPLTDHPTVSSPLTLERVQKDWSRFLLALRMQSQAVEAIIRNGKLQNVDGTAFLVQLGLPFHKEQLESTKYAGWVRAALTETFGPQAKIAYQVQLDPILQGQSAVVDTGDDQLLKAVEEAVLSLG